jgi:hypothetical protein
LKTTDEESHFSEDEIKAFEVENKALKEEATKNSDAMDRELRQPHMELITSIQKRLS